VIGWLEPVSETDEALRLQLGPLPQEPVRWVCTLVDPDTNPPEYYEDTLCSEECRAALLVMKGLEKGQLTGSPGFGSLLMVAVGL
jgi:hypothetical protein